MFYTWMMVLVSVPLARSAQSILKESVVLMFRHYIEQPEKCNWTPTQSLKWLGYIIDLDKFCIRIPPKKNKDFRLRSALNTELSAPKNYLFLTA